MISWPPGSSPSVPESFTAVHCHEQVVQRFRQSWVRKGAIAQGGIRQLAHHCTLDPRHNFATFDEAAIIRFNPGRRKVQSVRVRRSPRGDQQMRTGQSGRSAVLLDLQLNAPVNLSDVNRSCLQQDLNPVLLQDLANFSRDVGVLTSQQLAGRLNNSHTTAEAPKQLSKLQTNVATAP